MKSSEQKKLSETKVEEVLSEKPPSLQPQDTVHEAGERMRSVDADKWPVAQEQKLVGLVDERHPDRAAARFGHDPKSTLVGESMVRDVAYCYEDQSCAEALAIMEARGLKFLPVVDRQKHIAGIICRDELLAPAAGK